MPKLLLLVHGMGRHKPTWADDTTKQLVGFSTTYQYRWFEQNGTLDQHVSIVPVTYDAVFAKYMKKWGKTSEDLRTKAAEFGVSIPNVLGWLERADEEENNFFWSHVVDVVLYRFFSIVTAEVRLRVREAIAVELQKAKDDGGIDEASVLAHSLGTAVTHDSLALLGSHPIPTRDGPNEAFMAGNHKFANVFMCANVSRVLETDPKVYRSVVHPTTGGEGPAYVEAYYNFRHFVDPFTVVKEFAPVGWGDGYHGGDECKRFLAFNIHGLDEYLADPRVHVPILRRLVGPWAVSEQEERDAKVAYDGLPELPCVEVVRRFRQDADRVIALARVGADPETLVIAGTQFLAAAKRGHDECMS